MLFSLEDGESHRRDMPGFHRPVGNSSMPSSVGMPRLRWMCCMANGHRPRILAINSSQDVLNLFKELLSDEGYAVTIQSYMSHDLDGIVEADPELVILDYMWGGEDSGWSLLQMLKMDPRTKDIPIILCTGAVRQVEPLDARLAEMGVRVVLKPFDLDELLAAVSDTLQRSSASVSANSESQ